MLTTTSHTLLIALLERTVHLGHRLLHATNRLPVGRSVATAVLPLLLLLLCSYLFQVLSSILHTLCDSYRDNRRLGGIVLGSGGLGIGHFGFY